MTKKIFGAKELALIEFFTKYIQRKVLSTFRGLNAASQKLIKIISGAWRNWHTRTLQERMDLHPCGFNSHRAHQFFLLREKKILLSAFCAKRAGGGVLMFCARARRNFYPVASFALLRGAPHPPLPPRPRFAGEKFLRLLVKIHKVCYH